MQVYEQSPHHQMLGEKEVETTAMNRSKHAQRPPRRFETASCANLAFPHHDPFEGAGPYLHFSR
jgi:hypothetical protein